jgi:hypothetical protein
LHDPELPAFLRYVEVEPEFSPRVVVIVPRVASSPIPMNANCGIMLIAVVLPLAFVAVTKALKVFPA